MAVKRIVFQHTHPPYSGLVQIMGLVTDLGLADGEPLPTSCEGFEVLGRFVEHAGLVEVKRTYALYRETPATPEATE